MQNKIEIVKKTVIKMMACLCMMLMVVNGSMVRADDVETPVSPETDQPDMYVSNAYCYVSISSGVASVSSRVKGKENANSISATVYLEKLVNGFWQSYTSWTHSGTDQNNVDSVNVSHGAYRVWMSVTASGSGGSESFNVDGNVAGY